VPAAVAFTVAGTRPVLSSGSQDTHAQTPDASCDSGTFAADKALGAVVALGLSYAKCRMAPRSNLTRTLVPAGPDSDCI
jgi:hypothetical protein